MSKKRKRQIRVDHEKRNIFIFLLFVFFMGIGYSSLSTSLNVGGSVTISKYKEPVLRATSLGDTSAFRSNQYRQKIKTITLDDHINPPASYLESWDVGEAQNGNVMAYITVNQDDNNYYDLYIQGEGNLYANPNSSYLFYDLKGVDIINNIEKLDTSRVVNMASMFFNTGYNSTMFTLDLGNNFDTSQVINMDSMFYATGHDSTSFTLNLGDNFDTSSVTNMSNMFFQTGYSSKNFTLNLGDNFDTSHVTDMSNMFYQTGYNSTAFALNLGDKFSTSQVTDMTGMFYSTGKANTTQEIDLSLLSFDSVTSYSSIFAGWGTTQTIFVKDNAARNWVITNSANPSLTISNVLVKGACIIEPTYLNDKSKFRADTYREKIHNIYLNSTISMPNNVVESWDISQLQNGSVMAYITSTQTNIYDLYIQGDGRLYANPDSQYLFAYLTGVDSINNLEVLNTSRVTSMSNMFREMGYNSTSFTLDLGDNFDTSNVTNMYQMFCETGRKSTEFTIDLGDKFDTSQVTNMASMFSAMGVKSTKLTLDLGDKFDTSQVTTMRSMFNSVGTGNTSFKLNLGDHFNTSQVTNMSYMFQGTGTNSTVFHLDLGNQFYTSSVTNMQQMFHETGIANTTQELDLSSFTFDFVTFYSNIFYRWGSTQKIYVKDSASQNWIINNSGNRSLTTANVLIKS